MALCQMHINTAVWEGAQANRRNATIICITLPCLTSSLKLKNLPRGPKPDGFEQESAVLSHTQFAFQLQGNQKLFSLADILTPLDRKEKQSFFFLK